MIGYPVARQNSILFSLESREKQKTRISAGLFIVAGATGFEPAVSALTGPHVEPLHHAPERGIVYHEALDASRKLQKNRQSI